MKNKRVTRVVELLWLPVLMIVFGVIPAVIIWTPVLRLIGGAGLWVGLFFLLLVASAICGAERDS